MTTTLDRRRNNGPASSTPPQFTDSQPVTTSDDRQFFLKQGLVKTGNGSAYFEQGKSKLLVVIHGPRPIARTTAYQPTAKVHVDMTYAPFISRNRERDVGTILTNAIKPAILAALLPKSEIAIFVQVLEEDGESSTLAAAIIATSIALCDAGIECVDLISSIAISHHSGRFILWPTRQEEEEAGSDEGISCILSYLPQRKEITSIYMTGGNASLEVIDDIIKNAIAYLDTISLAMIKVLSD